MEDGGAADQSDLHIHTTGNVTLAMFDLSPEDHDTYYLGCSNGVLWPVCHYRLDLANFDTRFAKGYRRVNQLFARKLLTLLCRAAVGGLQQSYRLFPAHSDAAAADHGGDFRARMVDALALCIRSRRLPGATGRLRQRNALLLEWPAVMWPRGQDAEWTSQS
jgi:Glycosyltransferase family 20